MPNESCNNAGAEFPLETRLHDGTAILVRPVQADDKHHIEAAMQSLSPQARYFRFFHTVSQLTESELRTFTEIDHVNHEAIGAMDISEPVGRPIGLARYIRMPDKNDVAEVAVTVVDSHQGRGLGTLLLAFLAEQALRNGITRFYATVMAQNTRMLEVFSELGATVESVGSGEMDVCLPLFADATGFPQTPAGDVFRQVFSRRQAPD